MGYFRERGDSFEKEGYTFEERYTFEKGVYFLRTE